MKLVPTIPVSSFNAIKPTSKIHHLMSLIRSPHYMGLHIVVPFIVSTSET